MSLVSYDANDGSDDDSGADAGGAVGELITKPVSTGLISTLSLPTIDAAPLVALTREHEKWSTVDPMAKELNYNPKYEDLYAPVAGPSNPFKTLQQRRQKNMLTGFVEPAHFNDFHFESERKTYHTFGYAKDPSAGLTVDATTGQPKYVGDQQAAKQDQGATVFESKKTGRQKRKMVKNWDATDLDNYTGPWGKYVDEELVSKPDAETLKEMEVYALKRKKITKPSECADETAEKSVLHITTKDDYQGRSFMEAPKDGTNLHTDIPPEKCFIPKKLVHTYTGHTKGVQLMKWFPKTAHMLLSGGMDGKVKLWDVYGKRKCIRTYVGHRMGVRDMCFTNDGKHFLTSSFDRFTKLWDTETGQCVQRFTTNKVPFCCVYNPSPDKQDFFLTGMQDKKIIQWDVRSGEQTQEYDRHLGPVNTITFFDENRRFASSSDDKSIRIWEWEIPVDTKVISAPDLHAIPAVKMSPDGKWLVGQSMDNRIIVFQVSESKLRFAKKRAFKGHMNSGYACAMDYSPDMSYMISGDSTGKVFVWNFSTSAMVARWKAHDQVCIGSLWHPHEQSKIVTCGWDNVIKMWD